MFNMLPILFGFWLWMQQGYLRPATAAQQQLMSQPYEFAAAYGLGTCFLSETQQAEEYKPCRISGDGHGETFIWGDSYAAHWMPGLRSRPDLYSSLIQRSASACPPGLPESGQAYRRQCESIQAYVLEEIGARAPERVLLSARWREEHILQLPTLISKLRALGVREIVVLGPTPRWRGGVRGWLLAAGADANHIPTTLKWPQAEIQRGLSKQLGQIVAAAGASWHDPLAITCNATDSCQTTLNGDFGTLIYFDDGHLTSVGSIELARHFRW